MVTTTRSLTIEKAVIEDLLKLALNLFESVLNDSLVSKLRRHYLVSSEERLFFTMNPPEGQQDSTLTSRQSVNGEEQEEEDGMDDLPLAALAPAASCPEEKPSVSSDASVCPPVFQLLDELLSLGQISHTKDAQLKASYRLLCDTLKSAQESEVQLLGEAKRCRAELKRLQARVESMEEQSTSEETESEVKELRQQLLQACNELQAAEEREYWTQHQLKCLWEEKKYLVKENEIQTKPADPESETKAMQDKYEDLRNEVAQRQLEISSLMEDIEITEMQILKEEKELEDKKGIIEFKEAEKAQLIGIPDQILKETERRRTKKEAASKKIEALNMEIAEMELQWKKVDECNCSLEIKREDLIQEAEGLRGQVEASQRKYRQMLKEKEVSREEAGELLGNRGILEVKLQNIMFDRKYLYERHSVLLREKNRQMQALKRMEQSLNMSVEQLEHIQAIYNDLQARFDAVPKREASMLQRMELQKEVDALKVSFENQLYFAEEESQKKQQFGMIQELLRESNSLREELHNLRCLTQIKAEERGQKHRELLRAEQLKQHIQQELREKDLIIMENKKFYALLQRRISQYSKLCDMIMGEKNKYVSLKQITSQTITELEEQIQVLENEIEIQRSIIVNKDRLLIKARMKLSNCTKLRDKLRNDISKVAWKHRQVSEECKDNKQELMKLAQMSKSQEETLLETNKDHETAVQQRNSLGIQLLEHDEVLLNYYEKVNMQETAITEGNMAVENLEKDVKDLQLEITEERRQIDLKRKEILQKRKLEGDITMLQIELSEARDKTLEGLNRTVDYKELKGKDPSDVELLKKIELLEVNLAERERQLLEKELLVDQVTRLSKPLSEQVNNCREDQLFLAKKLNELRTNISHTNRRLMAVTAELSVKQAAAFYQQQQIREQQLQMDRCQQGLPLQAEIEEWRKMLRDKKRRQWDKREKERLAQEDEWRRLPNGVYTTAEARPNMYIPQDDSLPLPKPYGALAPFKPSQAGANMRHIRKPVIKPLEI